MTILTKEQWEASIAETWSASIKAAYQHLIDEAVKAEREACAQLCEASPEPDGLDLADRIRARDGL